MASALLKKEPPARWDSSNDRLTSKQFQRLAAFIQDYSGIKMPPTKMTMVEGRLRRRVRALDFESLAEYCDYLFEQDGLETEQVHLIDAVTTNKTDFFREPEHFRVLTDRSLPRIVAERRVDSRAPDQSLERGLLHRRRGLYHGHGARRVRAASTAISRASILATDICTEVLAHRPARHLSGRHAGAGAVRPAAPRYVMRSKDRTARYGAHRAGTARAGCASRRLNLMDLTYPLDRDMDIIFCRNILIYFDKPTQQAVLEPALRLTCGRAATCSSGIPSRLAGLRPAGQAAGNTVFRTRVSDDGEQDQGPDRRRLGAACARRSPRAAMRIPRSRSSATASDPFVAARRIQDEVPDVITLDVEMPRMDGITFLRKLMRQHPMPVVMCSSLTEEGSETLMQAMEAGAVDVILKPRVDAAQFLAESRMRICDAVKAAAQARLKRLPAGAAPPTARAAPQKKLTADAMLPPPVAGHAMARDDRDASSASAPPPAARSRCASCWKRCLPTAPGIVIVQHMPEKFTAAFARRLNGLCEVEVKEAADGDTRAARPGADRARQQAHAAAAQRRALLRVGQGRPAGLAPPAVGRRAVPFGGAHRRRQRASASS